jgi:hypothetical protein
MRSLQFHLRLISSPSRSSRDVDVEPIGPPVTLIRRRGLNIENGLSFDPLLAVGPVTPNHRDPLQCKGSPARPEELESPTF